MKRMICVLLASIICLTTVVVPVSSFAAELSQSAEKKIYKGLLRYMELVPDDALIYAQITLDDPLKRPEIEEEVQKEMAQSNPPITYAQAQMNVKRRVGPSILKAFRDTYLQDPCEVIHFYPTVMDIYAYITKEKIYELAENEQVQRLSNVPLLTSNRDIPQFDISPEFPKMEYKLQVFLDCVADDEQIEVMVNLNNVPSDAEMEAWIAEELKSLNSENNSAYDNYAARDAVRRRVYLPIEKAFAETYLSEICTSYRYSDISPSIFIRTTKDKVYALADNPLVDSLFYFYTYHPSVDTINGDHSAPDIKAESPPKPELAEGCSKMEKQLYDLMLSASEDEMFPVRIDLNKADLLAGYNSLIQEEMALIGGTKDDYDYSSAVFVVNRRNSLEMTEKFRETYLKDACEDYSNSTIQPTIYATLPKATILTLAENEAVDLIRYSMKASKPNPDKAVPFTDVSRSSYFYDAVAWAVSSEPKITKGTDSLHFSPEVDCTRAQAVTFLWNAAGCPEARVKQTQFTDVTAGAYYEKAVRWALENGIAKGTGAAAFSPDKKCTRAEILTMLWRAQKQPDGAGTLPFSDVPPQSFYTKAVAWAVEANITKGTSEHTFAPNRICTRAEIITLIYRTFA